MSKKHEIWSEGYRACGDSGTCVYHGVHEGETFIDAVKNWAKNDEEANRYVSISADGKSAHYWGCRLYDNKAHAEARFG